MILTGRKVWEIRGSSTKKRGWIALIKSGSKQIYGICNLVDVRGPLSWWEYVLNGNKQGLKLSDIDFFELPYKKTYAWVLQSPVALDHPVDYVHPSGAVIWVKVPLVEEIEGAIASADESFTRES